MNEPIILCEQLKSSLFWKEKYAYLPLGGRSRYHSQQQRRHAGGMHIYGKWIAQVARIENGTYKRTLTARRGWWRIVLRHWGSIEEPAHAAHLSPHSGNRTIPETHASRVTKHPNAIRGAGQAASRLELHWLWNDHCTVQPSSNQTTQPLPTARRIAHESKVTMSWTRYIVRE